MKNWHNFTLSSPIRIHSWEEYRVGDNNCSSLKGAQRDMCTLMTDTCSGVGSWPHVLKTDQGNFTAKDPEHCSLLASILAGEGYKFTGPEPKSAPTPESQPPPQTEPTCPKMSGKIEQNCREFVTICGGTRSWPYTIVTDQGSFTANNSDHCMQLAPMLAESGHRIVLPGSSFYKRGATGVPNSGAQKSEHEEHIQNPDDFDVRPAGDMLTLNTNLPHYKSGRSRTLGESDLRYQCTTATKEDSFLLVEGRKKSGGEGSTWYEIGINEQPQHTESKITSSFSKGVMDEFTSVTTYSRYHFHPNSGYEGSFGSEYPSPTDFEQVVKVAAGKKDQKMGYPAGIYDHRIVTVIGVWRFKPNFAAIQANPDGAESEAEKYAEKFNKRLGEGLIDIQDVGKAKKFAKETSSRYVGITFHPF